MFAQLSAAQVDFARTTESRPHETSSANLLAVDTEVVERLSAPAENELQNVVNSSRERSSGTENHTRPPTFRRSPGLTIGKTKYDDKLKITARTLILYFHCDVIAFDHNFVTWNAFLRWRPQNSAGFQVEIRTVPRTGDPGALNIAFRQWSATVRAGVADGIVSSLHVEEGYFLAFDCERSRLAGWHVLGLSYLEKFCHNA